jgi:hypothetical protein
MKVNTDETNVVPISKLTYGDVFGWEDDYTLYMVIRINSDSTLTYPSDEPSDEDKANLTYNKATEVLTVCLNTGEMCVFPKNEDVNPKPSATVFSMPSASWVNNE